MRIIIFLIIIIAIPISPAYSGKWTRVDTAREMTWIAIHVIDWGQTLDIARRSNQYSEINPLMGRHPSVGRVNNLMILGTVAHIGGAYLCPKNLRGVYQWTSIIVNAGFIIHNHKIGLKVRF